MTLEAALALRQNGNHQQARELLVALAVSDPLNAEVQYEAACVHLIRQQPQPSSRHELPDRYSGVIRAPSGKGRFVARLRFIPNQVRP